MAINNLSVSGNVGKDIELFTTQGGVTIGKFPVAVTSGFGDRKKTSWVECVMFNKFAEAMAPYITKGGKVAVNGEFSIETWDKNDGTQGQKVQLMVRDMEIMSGGNQGGNQQSQQRQQPAQQPAQQQQRQPAQQQQPQNFDDDIPF